MYKQSYFRSLFIGGLFLSIPAWVAAHPQGGVFALHSGFLHPFHGLDHLLAMIAVGLWAAQLGSSRKDISPLLVPLVFALTLSAGILLGAAGFNLPVAETGILLSVIALGIFIAAALHLPLPVSAATVALFAFCHGYAHGAEIPAQSAVLFYTIGSFLSTMFLHLCGLGLGFSLQKAKTPALRWTGLGIAASGIYLAVI